MKIVLNTVREYENDKQNDFGYKLECFIEHHIKMSIICMLECQIRHHRQRLFLAIEEYEYNFISMLF